MSAGGVTDCHTGDIVRHVTVTEPAACRRNEAGADIGGPAQIHHTTILDCTTPAAARITCPHELAGPPPVAALLLPVATTSDGGRMAVSI